MTNRKEAINYLLELEKEEPKWTELPEDDTRIVKLRLLFSAESSKASSSKRGKRRKWKKVRMVHKGNEKIFKSLSELCKQMNFNKDSVKNYLDMNREYKGMLFYRVYEDEEVTK